MGQLLPVGGALPAAAHHAIIGREAQRKLPKIRNRDGDDADNDDYDDDDRRGFCPLSRAR